MIDTNRLHRLLAQRRDESRRHLKQRHPKASALLTEATLLAGSLRHYAARLMTSGTLVSSILLTMSPPASPSGPLQLSERTVSLLTASQLRETLMLRLTQVLPRTMETLTPSQESQVAQMIQTTYGIRAAVSLDGLRLNHSYGFIGAEQHLLRFPGDSARAHGRLVEAGIAPRTGAWGYFSPSRSALTADLAEKEKYYVAVQTLYLPDWNRSQPALKNWYKYRKVVVVNPTNGRAVVAVIADAGPANWTGKQFGGSPEVMEELGITTGKRKGAVILLFVDDPQDQVPLGELMYNVKKVQPPQG